MTPVTQTLFGDMGAIPAERGNCYPACLASILDLGLDEVPHFYGNDEAKEVQNGNTTRWLRSHGWTSLGWDWPVNEHMLHLLKGCYAIFSGDSPRFPGTKHAVVGVITAGGWRTVHDPHPSRDGIDSADFVEVLMRLPWVEENPAYHEVRLNREEVEA